MFPRLFPHSLAAVGHKYGGGGTSGSGFGLDTNWLHCVVGRLDGRRALFDDDDSASASTHRRTEKQRKTIRWTLSFPPSFEAQTAMSLQFHPSVCRTERCVPLDIFKRRLKSHLTSLVTCNVGLQPPFPVQRLTASQIWVDSQPLCAIEMFYCICIVLYCTAAICIRRQWWYDVFRVYKLNFTIHRSDWFDRIRQQLIVVLRCT